MSMAPLCVSTTSLASELPSRPVSRRRLLLTAVSSRWQVMLPLCVEQARLVAVLSPSRTLTAPNGTARPYLLGVTSPLPEITCRTWGFPL